MVILVSLSRFRNHAQCTSNRHSYKYDSYYSMLLLVYDFLYRHLMKKLQILQYSIPNLIRLHLSTITLILLLCLWNSRSSRSKRVQRSSRRAQAKQPIPA